MYSPALKTRASAIHTRLQLRASFKETVCAWHYKRIPSQISLAVETGFYLEMCRNKGVFHTLYDCLNPQAGVEAWEGLLWCTCAPLGSPSFSPRGCPQQDGCRMLLFSVHISL